MVPTWKSMQLTGGQKRERHYLHYLEGKDTRSCYLYSYCECLAAGLYCIKLCLCLDCFNNPGNEGTVLETRGQIESRNPLAFAPKVIRNLDSASEFGVRNSPKL